MQKCHKCEHEYEGKFCPVCGERAGDERCCPGCGKTIGSSFRFCNECGHDFEKSAAAAPRETPPAQQAAVPAGAGNASKYYGLLGFAPAILFALFSLLLFVFYIAPVAVMPAQDFMGERIPSESFGNVYSMVSDFPSLGGAMITLIIFAVLSLIFAVFAALACFHSKLKEKELTLPGKYTIGLKQIFSYASFVFYLLFFVVGLVVIGTIAAEDGGMEIVSAGACPILLIVFSLAFAALAAGSIVGRFLLAKKSPSLKENEIKNIEQSRAQRQAAFREFSATHGAPVKPEIVEKPKNKSAGMLKDVNSYLRYKRLMVYIFVAGPLILACLVAGVGTGMFFGQANKATVDIVKYIFIGCLGTFAVFSILFIPLALRKVKSVTPKHIRASGGVTTISLLCLLPAIILSCIMLPASIIEEVGLSADLLMIFGGFFLMVAVPFLVLFFFAVIGTKKKKKRLCNVLYGMPKPKSKTNPVIPFEKVNADCAAERVQYNKDVAAYKACKYETSAYKFKARRYEKGRDYSSVPKVLVWADVHKASIISVTASVVAVAVALVIVLSIVLNIFQISRVNQIELGYTHEQVEEILGAPYEKSTDARWQYFDGSYLDITGKLDENTEKQKNAFDSGDFDAISRLAEEETKLKERLENLQYRYIEILFDKGTGSEYKAVQVRMDMSRNEKTPAEKSLKVVEVTDGVIRSNSTEATVSISYKAEFSDGSYIMSKATATLTGTVGSAGSTVTVEWRDNWCDKYSAPITVS